MKTAESINKQDKTAYKNMSKKILLVILLVAVFVVVGGYFVFSQKSVVPETTQGEESVRQYPSPSSQLDKTETPITAQTEPKINSELGPCFFDLNKFSSTDTSSWETFSSKFTDGGGDFEFKYSESLKISQENPDEPDSASAKTFLLSSSVSSDEARLTIYDLKRSRFSIGGNIASPGLSYEPLSDKWFKVNFFGDSLEKSIQECLPNPIATTDRGVSIYYYGEGDVGYNTASYIVIGRDSYALNHRGTAYPTPILLEFRVFSDPGSDSDSSEKFKKEIESLIKTINFPVADNRT